MDAYPTKDMELGGEITATQSSPIGEVNDVGLVNDAVFGQLEEGAPNYRNLGWIGTIGLMMKTQIGLGVLSIPAIFDSLGMIPGIICLIVIGVITTWSDYMVGVFKINHPEIYAIDDVGAMLFGPIGRELFAGAYALFYIFVAGSGILSVSIALNALSTHAVCTAIFVLVGAIVGFTFSSIRTLARLAILTWIGCGSIIISILVLTISVGVQKRPASAPQQGPWQSDWKLIGNPTFMEAISSIGGLVFAYAGTPAFFSIVAEMKNPRQYTKALVICQSAITVVYIVIGVVVYYFCGSFVASPALGSAGVTMKKVCYGLALPGLCIPAKFVFVRVLRGSTHLSSNSVTHWVTWIGCTFGITLISYIIASAIPVFGGLVSLIGALFGTLLSFQPYALMWLYDNWHLRKNVNKLPKSWLFMVGWCGFVILSGMFLMVAGTYGSVVEIAKSYKESGGSAAWSCKDNSGSV
ncbi:hypothetical protein E4T48_07908 [Aureobasidium sp. EXF-10727]|nr:hypothetical protein E4T48_07908 [Aureobasidium sp. EXF-10727]